MTVYFKFLWPLIFLSIASSCVATKKYAIKTFLSRARDTKASGVKYEPLPSYYIKEKKASLDAFWFYKKNKSSISYFSNCSKENPYLTLKNMEKDILSDVAYTRVIHQEKSSNHRYSVIRTKAYKTINGIYTLKPNSCFFIFNLISPSLSTFKKEEPTFKKFIKGFKFL